MKEEILVNLYKQLNSFFSLKTTDHSNIESVIEIALLRALNCLKQINNKYYSQLNLVHSGQYATILYLVANELFRKIGRNDTSEKLYYLNKIMHSIDLYYEVQLPDLFHWEHPIGTVLGRAQYGKNFVVYQNCTVGGSWNKLEEIKYPTLGNDVILYSYSSVIGECRIGNNVILASHTYILNQDIPDNSIVFGQGKDIIVKPNNKSNNFFKNE